jgi:conjugative relaxase-like TrwC/TraI family protein
MLFLNHFKNASAAKEYFAHLSQGDYFARDASPERPVYEGKTAGLLGLSGMEATKESFYALCDNRHPVTGEKLTSRDKDNRRILTDMTFDVPKSVTQAALYDDRIDKVVNDSICETMAEVESEMSVRVRKNGKNEDRVSGNIMYVVWPHETTRPLEDGTVDPHKHRHVTVLNVSYDAEEESLKACQFGNIVRDKGYYQAAYHSRVAHGLKELGYGIKKDRTSFTLAGIERETTDKFSRRTAVIEAEAEKKGITDAASKAQLGRKTREKKSGGKSLGELRAEWDARLTPEERLAIKTAGNGFAKGDDAITAAEAKNYALDHSFERASAMSEKRLKAEALNYAVGSVRPEEVADIAKHPEAIGRKHDGQLMLTTKTVLKDELEMLRFAHDGQRKFKPLVEPDAVKEQLAGLSAEQRKAALHPLTSRDQVTGIRGGAGTGKTHTLTTVNAVISSVESGSGDYSKVFAFAPSSNASRGELRKVGFKNAETLAKLFHSEEMQAQLHKQVILVDEAGLVSSSDMRRLFGIAKKQEARVVLVGDYRQHSSVEAGDAFRLLEKEAGIRYAELKEIRRQTTPGYKKAVEQISSGKPEGARKGFDALDKMGCVIEAEGEERHQLLVNDYLKATEEGKSALIIAPTHAEGRRLTEELRGILKQQGAIGEERDARIRLKTGWTEAQQRDVRNYEPGMVVQFVEAIPGKRQRVEGKRVTLGGFGKGESVSVVGTDGGQLKLLRRNGEEALLPVGYEHRYEVFRTRDISVGRGDRIRITRNGEMKVEGQSKGTQVNNGDVYPIEGFTKEGDYRLPDGKVMPRDWGHFAHGYVDTSYASQGKNVDRVFIAVGNESLPASNQQQWYVSASRGKEAAKIYVEDKQDVRDAIGRTGERLSAVELTQAKLRPSWRERVKESFERNRITRFLKQRAASIADSLRSKRREGPGYV